MNFKSNKDIKEIYSQLIGNANSSKDEIKHQAQMLMYRFLSEVERITEDRGIIRKDLAKAVGVTPSYLTQLYRGNKPLNIETLAKFENALDFRFEVKAVAKELLEVRDINITTPWDEEQINAIIQKFNCPGGLWIYKNLSNYGEELSNESNDINIKDYVEEFSYSDSKLEIA